MDRMQRFALKKTVDGLDKVLKAKEHFDKREEKKAYTKKLILLKQHLTDIMFNGVGDEKSHAYKQISDLNLVQAKHDFDPRDKRFIDEMMIKHDLK